MAAVLHLIKTDAAAFALATIAAQLAAGDRVSVVLMAGAPVPKLPPGVSTRRIPDDLSYDQLLDLIFTSDQVTAW
jgi:hypothetical protein